MLTMGRGLWKILLISKRDVPWENSLQGKDRALHLQAGGSGGSWWISPWGLGVACQGFLQTCRQSFCQMCLGFFLSWRISD